MRQSVISSKNLYVHHNASPFRG